jgi:hypothetical protein
METDQTQAPQVAIGEVKRVNNLLQFFEYKHLPAGDMQECSAMFNALAYTLEKLLPINPESTSAFRKLLEAKDCAVRAIIYK